MVQGGGCELNSHITLGSPAVQVERWPTHSWVRSSVKRLGSREHELGSHGLKAV